ncbi:MAG: rhomboid family intramembrane serine protease [Phycisphaerales bacterium]|nr:rhomboid family intramembrane serine protease [Phycisphaerales bacterium]
MGLQDRDYLRSGASSFAGSGLRKFTANTMLILACVIVAMADSIMPTEWVQTSQVHFVEGGEAVTRELMATKEWVISPVITGDTKQSFGTAYMVPFNPKTKEVLAAVGSIGYQFVSPLRKWLQFTTAQALVDITPQGVSGFEFWRFIGFQFLHVGMMHLVLNMVGLWVFGPLVEERLGARRYLAFYLFCGMMGAFLYLLLNAAGLGAQAVMGPDANVPGLLFTDPWTPLIGASAGVFGVIVAGAVFRPNETIVVMFVLPMRLATFAICVIAFALYNMLTAGQNAGGETAHMGGALAGWWLARRPHLINDFFSIFGRAPRASAARMRSPVPRDVPNTIEVDRILDKVHAGGLQSLSDAEKETLRRATNARQS